MSSSGAALLPIFTLSEDKLRLLIRKGTKVPYHLANAKHADLAEALNKLNINLIPDKRTVNVIRDAARTGTHAADDFEVCVGRSPEGAKPGRWEWIESLRRPSDHAVKDEPLIRIIPPAAPQPGMTVQGEMIPAREEAVPEPIVINLPPELERRPDGVVVARASGQVKVEGENIIYEPTYVVEKAHAPEFAYCEFFSDVHVLSDLIGTMKWRVFGKLEVEGHWQASDIEVFGDVTAKGGIQTNMVGTLRFWHNCQTTYIQVSQVGVLGSLVVENSVQLSELRVGGDMTCSSNPGAILGSTIHIFGGLRANKVGSENGQKTRIVLLGGEEARTTRIDKLLQGTMITMKGETLTAAVDTSFDSSAAVDASSVVDGAGQRKESPAQSQ
ncbi:MAG: Flagellar Assembly Protein [Pseudomonadota bacterium]